ncbi:hypothetical protein SKAU_G00094460 [Synaphobranchus kaupii]|uniref:Reverse transcriptase n=1 Tax=Synaphobranchus kaupii TaxID=118154 RepID=A0A9Q1FY61_SYNKA|nr:hypothetical protein SKAU_G00094460 [Synaphobranchus kaupii]
MVELDSEPTTEELDKAIGGIAAELIKCSKNTMLKNLHNLLCQCWREGAVPQNMRDANIVTSYKTKGDRACTDFGLTISLNKTNVMGQGIDSPPSITINNYKLEVVNQFTYLRSKICDNLLLDADINGRIGACVISTLLYGSETCMRYARHKKKLNSFHLRCLRRILNTTVLSHAQMPSMYTLLKQRQLRWLGHVHRMEDGRIPKDVLYGELVSANKSAGPDGIPAEVFKHRGYLLTRRLHHNDHKHLEV